MKEKDSPTSIFAGNNVYLMRHGNSDNYKIGYSCDPPIRMKGLQTGAPEQLHLIFCCKGDIQVERIFHNKYHKEKIRGEWFKFFSNDILKVIDEMRIFNYLVYDDGSCIFDFEDENFGFNLSDSREYLKFEIFKLEMIVKYADIIKDNFEYIYHNSVMRKKKIYYDNVTKYVRMGVNAGQLLDIQLSRYQEIILTTLLFDDIEIPNLDYAKKLAQWLLLLDEKKVLSDISHERKSIETEINIPISHFSLELDSREQIIKHIVPKNFGINEIKENSLPYQVLCKILNSTEVIMFDATKSLPMWQLLQVLEDIYGTFSKYLVIRLMDKFIKDNPQYAIDIKIEKGNIIYIGLGFVIQSNKENNPINQSVTVLTQDQIRQEICKRTQWSKDQYQKLMDINLISIVNMSRDINFDASIMLIKADIIRHILTKLNRIHALHAEAMSIKNRFEHAIIADMDNNTYYDNILRLATIARNISHDIKVELSLYEESVNSLPSLELFPKQDLTPVLSILTWIKELGNTNEDMKAHVDQYRMKNKIPGQSIPKFHHHKLIPKPILHHKLNFVPVFPRCVLKPINYKCHI